MACWDHRSFLVGTYKIPNFEVTGHEVATNKTPVEAYRAPGAPQAFFALESAIDELAVQLDIDPVELRLRNASREGDLMADGKPWPRIAMVECLEEARRHPLYSAPCAPGEAVGVALGSWGGARRQLPPDVALKQTGHYLCSLAPWTSAGLRPDSP